MIRSFGNRIFQPRWAPLLPELLPRAALAGEAGALARALAQLRVRDSRLIRQLLPSLREAASPAARIQALYDLFRLDVLDAAVLALVERFDAVKFCIFQRR